MRLEVSVCRNRDYLGSLTVNDHGRILAEFEVSAKSNPALLGSIDPPEGTYRLSHIQDVAAIDYPAVATYGYFILYFERVEDRTKVEPNLNGKHILVIHGGELSLDGNISPTEGGIKLRDRDLLKLIGIIGSRSQITLTITEEEAGIFDRFTRSRVSKFGPPIIILNPRQVERMRNKGYGAEYEDKEFLPYWWLLYEALSRGEDATEPDVIEEDPTTAERCVDFRIIEHVEEMSLEEDGKPNNSAPIESTTASSSPDAESGKEESPEATSFDPEDATPDNVVAESCAPPEPAAEPAQESTSTSCDPSD